MRRAEDLRAQRQVAAGVATVIARCPWPALREGFDPDNAFQRLGRGFMSQGWVSVIRRPGEEAGAVMGEGACEEAPL